MTSAFPGTTPARRAYPPPLPPLDPNAVGGQNATDRAARLQQVARQQYIDWRTSFSPNVSGQDRRDSADMFSVSDAAASLKPALDEVAAERDAAQAAVDAAVKGQRVDATDVAAQLAAERFWRRTERTLDSIKDVPKLANAARDLVADASDSELPVINEELGPYLASRNVPTDWLNDALAQRVPGLDDLRSEAALKAKRYAMLAQNHAGLTKAFAAGTPPPPALLDPFSPTINAEPYRNGEPWTPPTATK
jgi:hypothetical protein